jgi:hypothetical protein
MSSSKSRQKKQASRNKKRAAQYKRDLTRLKNFGIYEPSETLLTKYRKSRINKLIKENSEFFTDTFFVSAPAGSKDEKRIFFKKAKSLGIKTTKRGLLIPKEEYTSAKLRRSKSKRNEYEVARRHKIKRGPNAGKIYTDIIPSENIDSITSDKGRLQRIADQLGPFGKKDRLAFRIIDNHGEGLSHFTFSNIRLLLDHLETYKRSDAARLMLYRSIVIEKTTAVEWQELRRVKFGLSKEGIRKRKARIKKAMRKPPNA